MFFLYILILLVYFSFMLDNHVAALSQLQPLVYKSRTRPPTQTSILASITRFKFAYKFFSSSSPYYPYMVQ
jgi:hypothetical protein